MEKLKISFFSTNEKKESSHSSVSKHPHEKIVPVIKLI